MSLDGYQAIFDHSKAWIQELDPSIAHNTFREGAGGQHPFHFITAVGAQMDRPDLDAIGIAALTDPVMCVDYMARKKSSRGYASPARYLKWDVVDSRHIMMSTIVFSALGRSVGSIVEIGGGFGNWVRLNETVVDYKTWTIIDMSFVVDLQRWYLAEELQEPEKISFVSLEDYPRWRAQQVEHDLVIGAHSLSEFPWEVFVDYFENVLVKSKYVFYATHLRLPSQELVDMKLQKIETCFERERTVFSEGGAVANILYRRKP
jgi:hypothetical protein